jgi:hypothetical protein
MIMEWEWHDRDDPRIQSGDSQDDMLYGSSSLSQYR